MYIASSRCLHFLHFQKNGGLLARLLYVCWGLCLTQSLPYLPDTSTTSPGTISFALTFWTPDLSPRTTLPISGSYSLSASMADSAFLSCEHNTSYRTEQNTSKILPTIIHSHTQWNHETNCSKNFNTTNFNYKQNFLCHFAQILQKCYKNSC